MGAILKMKDLSLKDKKGLPNERIYNKIQDFVWDDVLSKYVCLPEVLDYVECFTGPNIRAVHFTKTSTTSPSVQLTVSWQPGLRWSILTITTGAWWFNQEPTKAA